MKETMEEYVAKRKEAGKLTKTNPKANYFGPAQGPFRCDHCEYFLKPRGCSKVAGDIDPAGCCNLFEKEK